MDGRGRGAVYLAIARETGGLKELVKLFFTKKVETQNKRGRIVGGKTACGVNVISSIKSGFACFQPRFVPSV